MIGAFPFQVYILLGVIGIALPSSAMSSNHSNPYDQEPVAHIESDSGFDTESFVLELLKLLLLDNPDEDEDDTEITSNFAHPSMSNQEISEWQWNISAEPGASLAASHIQTARAPVHLQAERPTERSHQVSAVAIFLGRWITSCSSMQCLVPIVG